MGQHAEVPATEKVAGILSPRLGSDRIAEIVELLYGNASGSLAERIEYARSKKRRPYRVDYARVHGITWRGRMICGHNPHLHARLVDDLRVETDDSGKEVLRWTERPEPKNPLLKAKGQT